MAEEEKNDPSQKTEEPTEKRKRDAKKEGQVASSKELSTWAIMVVATFVIFGMGPGIASDIKGLLRGLITKSHEISLSHRDTLILGKTILKELVWMLFLPALFFVVTALLIGFAQTGGNFSTKSLKPKLEKISLLKGFKKIISLKSLVEMLKALFKIIIIGYVCYLIVRHTFDSITTIQTLQITEFYAMIHERGLQLFIGVLAIITLMVVGDYAYQKFNLLKQLRMSKQDIKDEHKQTEGDPKVKQKLRQIRMQRAQQRLSDVIPGASVVITNPTHYAVALKYEADNMNAPVVVAKGMDHLAFTIRRLAEESDVPIVENKPLARALYARVEVDDEIPEDAYEMVAEVIRFVMKKYKKKF